MMYCGFVTVRKKKIIARVAYDVLNHIKSDVIKDIE